MKRHEGKPHVLQFGILPSFWVEFICILTVYTFNAMHVIGRESNPGPFWNEHRGFSIYSATLWQISGIFSNSDIYRNLGVQSVGFQTSII